MFGQNKHELNILILKLFWNCGKRKRDWVFYILWWLWRPYHIVLNVLSVKKVPTTQAGNLAFYMFSLIKICILPFTL